MKPRPMALTPDLAARVHRAVDDAGQEPGLSYQTDEDYDDAVEATLASHPADQDPWLFAYGSLIWKPEVEHVEAWRGRPEDGTGLSASASCATEARRISPGS